MSFLNFWPTRQKESAESIDFIPIDHEYAQFEKSIKSDQVSIANIYDLREINGNLTRIIKQYDSATKQILKNSSLSTKKQFSQIKNTLVTQRVIVKSLFLLSEQGCATEEDIAKAKKESEYYAAKIEKEIADIMDSYHVSKSL